MSGWTLLDARLADEILLRRFTHSSSGYVVELTDLSRVWAEQLTKDEIIQRSFDADTISIDPGENEEQFSIFLGKIESALNRDAGTTLLLRRTEHNESSALSIDLSAPLPQPLPPFNWTIRFQRLSDHQIGSMLVVPLLLQVSKLQVQQVQLLEEVGHSKDRVIAKLCDRLESSGTDLSIVFPSQSNKKLNRKVSQREQLAKYVPGLGDFDLSAWKAQTAANEETNELDKRLIGDVLQDLPQPSESIGSVDWWSGLKIGPRDDHMPGLEDRKLDSQSRGRSSSTDALARERKDVQTDAFQRQLSPLAVQHKRRGEGVTIELGKIPFDVRRNCMHPNGASSDPQDDDVSTDEDLCNLDAASRAPQGWEGVVSASQDEPEATSSPSTKMRKLGTIGGRSRKAAMYANGDEASPQPSKTLAAAPKSRLGAIGGRKAATGESVKNAERTLTALPDTKSTSPQESKGREMQRPQAPKQSPAPAEAAHEEGSGGALRLSEGHQEPPVDDEDLQMKADQKRDRLKRELEDKMKAPIKKTRKF